MMDMTRQWIRESILSKSNLKNENANEVDYYGQNDQAYHRTHLIR